MELSITKAPCLSTAHLKPETVIHIVTLVGDNTMVAEYEYGFFIYIGEEPVPGWPEDLEAAAKLARDHGYTWLRFDADGDDVEGLVVYEWS